MSDGVLVLRGRHDRLAFGVLTAVLLAPLATVAVTGRAAAPLVALAASGLVLLLFVGSFMAGRILAPATVSPYGLRVRTAALASYDTHARWTQIDRIWLSRVGRVPCLLVRLHDPAAAADDNLQVLRTMRANRRRYGAELLISLAAVASAPAEIEAAIDFFSGNSRRLESVVDD
ncbi:MULTISPECIES: hypothetical protein [Catenuloplanes]|uniref:PH domain-containing protein n=1 Tax=Catenuloplanes niger TaxID=587534 RepID=A0AAE4CTL9_9ACTN|nr:hypothetical protein [Catenuloplanes niger]MDR7325466.1 hypothetical protein [Catenuloplanes niger]